MTGTCPKCGGSLVSGMLDSAKVPPGYRGAHQSGFRPVYGCETPGCRNYIHQYGQESVR